MISALIIMAGVTVANMSHRLLHKLILLEVSLPERKKGYDAPRLN